MLESAKVEQMHFIRAQKQGDITVNLYTIALLDRNTRAFELTNAPDKDQEIRNKGHVKMGLIHGFKYVIHIHIHTP